MNTRRTIFDGNMGSSILRMSRPNGQFQMRFLLNALCLLILSVGSAHAQTVIPSSRSYLTPFPEGDKYNIYVIGDSLGEGLWSGMRDILRDDRQFQLFRKIHYGTSFARATGTDWAARLEDILRNENVHVAVLYSGAAERQNIWAKGKKFKVGSEEWRDYVSKRVDRLIKRLKRDRIAVYWLGLPVMRAPKVNTQMQALNEIFRERAFLNGVKFIDTWNAFADQFGRYSAFGPDLEGKVKRLRADDGIHFTFRGNKKLAHFVYKEVSKDVALAREERNIPLAGNEKEQRLIHAKIKKKKPVKAATDKKSIGGTLSAITSGWFSLTSEQKDGQTDEMTLGEIKILRPKLRENAVSAFGSRARRNNQNTVSGEQIAKQIVGDITALSSISSMSAVSLGNVKRAVPLAEKPYYKVLIQGHGQASKPGRADDFSWPKLGGNSEKSDSLKRESENKNNVQKADG